MSQPSNRILTPDMLSRGDYRNQFVEVATNPNDFATADSSLILSTVPFLPSGDHFVDIPIYPLGMTQSFSWNEGMSGRAVPEIGSGRKTMTAGGTMGNGSISKLIVHGNSILMSLYRPTLAFIKSTQTLDAASGKMFTGGNQDWIKGLAAVNIDLYSTGIDDYVTRVIAGGGLNSILYKIPFGLIEIKRDPRQRVLEINFFEQCSLRGKQGGQTAGQPSLTDSLSFEFERHRALLACGPFSLSDEEIGGL